jgi:asparagine synthase (glutamine-hydrolysing)
MCGIGGIVRTRPSGGDAPALGRMAAAMRHRGPDGYGFYLGTTVGFTHLRLSIVDLAGGAQPMTNEDGRIVVTYNGEIYNHVELRQELERHGHSFRTTCDTEVLVHGYEEWGAAMLDRLNGQFAFALYDRRNETVFLARDRFGVRPLFYAESDGTLYFASEIKGLLATGEVSAAIDAEGFDQAFTFWAPLPPRTPFHGIRSLEPGTYATWRHGSLQAHRYYHLDYSDAVAEPDDALRSLDALLNDSVRFRLRADVPVGAYLSGGLDSSITSALAARVSPFALRTFSITFDDPRYDESAHQLFVAKSLGSVHTVAAVRQNMVAESFPAVVWHAETPLLRTAPVPMFQLAQKTREAGIKVVLTGEGADELFLGYDLFKEVSVRRFCLRRPESQARQRLFERLYPYMASARGGEFWRKFFLEAGAPDDPLFSHMPRFLLTSRIKDFYSPDFRARLGAFDPMDELRQSLPSAFAGWSDLNKAAYLEMVTLLSPYLLSTQGDRMAMAHGVEGRYPFLDHRLHEFAAALPTGSRLRGLREKEILRRWAKGILPPEIQQRTKQPYRAPDAPSFFAPGSPSWIQEALSPDSVRAAGIFASDAVAALARRAQSGRSLGVWENQALVAVLSSQLWHEQFVRGSRATIPLGLQDADVVLRESNNLISSFPKVLTSCP